MTSPSVSEADLQAYTDALLPSERCGEVESYLDANPEEAARIRAYLGQKQALRSAFNPVLDEPLPDRLQSLASRSDSHRQPFLVRWPMQRIAAGLVIALTGGVAGWMAHDRYPTTGTLAAASVPALPRQAAVAHVVFSPDIRRPVEIRAEQEDQLVAWLSKRLGTPVRPPRLGSLGYELIGGRLLPGNSGPVAQFMYHDATGQRLTLYVTTENTTNQDTAFRFIQEGPVNVFYWVDGKFGYALSAGIDKGALARVATAVYDQMEKK